MSQLDLNNVKRAAEQGRVANTYLIIGGEKSDPIGSAISLIRSILKSPYSGLEIHQQNTELESLNRLENTDIHYFYPVNTTAEIKKSASSSDFIKAWRELVINNSKISLFDWYEKIGLGNKQGVINVDEAERISKLASLKAFGGGVKIFVIWMAEKINLSASNKLLKLLEEPPKKTVFILVSENEKKMLKTITSRCQKIYLSSQNSENQNVTLDFKNLFVEWVRAAFKVKGNKTAINELIEVSEKLSKRTREEQKEFLIFCSTVFRDSILFNYKSVDPSNKYDGDLDLAKFAKFVHEENILGFYTEIQKGYEDIERNGNPKIIFLDISIKLTRLFHTKPIVNG
tara:strand:+ start:6194 stop:7222 length:1029 start_codon:yes stop_codon:yes gene_type:complete